MNEVRFGASRQWRGASSWRREAAFEIAPTTNARLTTRLPTKYPGEDINATAVVMTLRPAVTITCGTRRTLSLTAAYTRTLSYLRARQYNVDALTVSIGVGQGS